MIAQPGGGDAGGARVVGACERKLMVLSDLDDIDELWRWVPQWRSDGVDAVAFVGARSSQLFDRFIDVCAMLDLDGEGRFILGSWFADADAAMELLASLDGSADSPVCVLHAPA
ncbi:hypothetical protein SAMN04487939_12918 [Lysobacter sp. yr284]|uniref:hypothetical protein n=1 Tax=Lysobacter TaxID=68 RepID=UPI000896EDE0|nr:hypothetical protein [Lysobacter sp. yr284]SDZ27185.1 hypothetical protein SAMN04487939_12918 [Lysobacter sp. yr284]